MNDETVWRGIHLKAGSLLLSLLLPLCLSKAGPVFHQPVRISGSEAPRVAIVGSGIGGSFSAAFLREKLGSEVELVV